MIRACKFSSGVSHKAPHHHDCHQLLYITKGSAKIYIDNTEYDASDDCIVIFSRLETHSITVFSETYERFELRITPDKIPEFDETNLYSVLVNRPQGFKHIIKAEDSDILPLFKRVHKEFSCGGEYRDVMLEMLFKQILISIYRINSNLFSVNDEQAFIVKKIQQRLSDNLKEPFTLASLSQEYHLSKYYLSHIFKSVTGYPIINYLQSLRIAEAKRLLTKKRYVG